jgi:hypothetical protein
LQRKFLGHPSIALMTGGFALCATAAIAADIPQAVIKAPPNAAFTQSSSGFYIWADGKYQSVGLPGYDIGAAQMTSANQYIGPAQRHDVRATGYGIAAAAGYILPDGSFSTAYGSNRRIEFGLSYVNAHAAQNQYDSAGPRMVAQAVSGLIYNLGPGPAFVCVVPCQMSSTLTSDYAAWQFNLKTASDFKLGAVTLTPAFSVFGGHARNDQTFFQAAQNGYRYSAASRLKWTDWGAKFELGTKTDVARWLTVGLDGSIGLARRNVSMSASDVIPFLLGDPQSSVSGNDAANAFLANAEASLTIKPLPYVAIKAFAGLNYDNHVPGLSAATFAVSGPGVQGTPVGIKYEAETSYYAGGGVTVKFAP